MEKMHKVQREKTLTDLDPRVSVHYGIPSTASILAFDPVQRLMAIGTLDGRIKVVGGNNIEGLLLSPKQLPFKNLEFLENQGFLASVSNENEVQVWDLKHRCIASNLQWESNITAFSVIYGTHYMYIGDEYGFLSVLKYDVEKRELLQLPYHLPADVIAEAAGISLPSHQSIVGVLPQPTSLGNRVLLAYGNGHIILWDVTEDRAVLVRGNKDLQPKDGKVVYSPDGIDQEQFTNVTENEQEEKEISSLCWASSDGTIIAVGYVDGDILLWNLSTVAASKGQQGQKASSNVVKVQLSSGEKRLPVIVLHWSQNSAHNDHGGKLYVYGGDDIGSEEVLTILNLDWSSGIENAKCIGRLDLTLNGSFADMILVPNAGTMEGYDILSLFVLSNPGQLHFYDDSCLSALLVHPEKKHSVPAVQYPEVIPTAEPNMTIGRLKLIKKEESFSRPFSETLSAAKLKDQYCSNVCKKRKTLPQWTEEVKLCSETGQGSLDDGFSWRKYGQKVILGANFPRAYYRCTHQHGRGCLARKHVQRSDEDPSIFKVIYRGRHTCNQTRQVTPSSTSSGIEFPEQISGPSSRPIFDGENSGQSQDLFFNYETALALKTEEMNPSFSFPCSLIQPDNMESNVFAEFLKENDFISADPSESAFYTVLPDQMDDFRLGQNWQHSESDGNETISAPASVTNSPMGNLDFTLDQVDFDPNFPFDTCELFS